jgi:hypothetical protein
VAELYSIAHHPASGAPHCPILLHSLLPRGISKATPIRSEAQAMTTFDDRESAFENKFAHDEEMKFRAEARANKLLGLWAAGLLGKSGEDADAYAREVIHADFEEAGHEDVVRKVAGDLGDRSSPDEIRAKRAEMLVKARAQLVEE